MTSRALHCMMQETEVFNRQTKKAGSQPACRVPRSHLSHATQTHQSFMLMHGAWSSSPLMRASSASATGTSPRQPSHERATSGRLRRATVLTGLHLHPHALACRLAATCSCTGSRSQPVNIQTRRESYTEHEQGGPQLCPESSLVKFPVRQ